VAGHEAVHRTILVVDIEHSSYPARTDADLLLIRKALYQALAVAFKRTDWLTYYHEDRGDGALVLVPPDVPKIRLVTNVLKRLETALNRHNDDMRRKHGTKALPRQIRLRVAIHAGEVTFDDHGVVGAAITHAFRLAEAPPLKAAFTSSTGVYALIVSEWFFNEVVRHYEEAQPDLYRKIECRVKETELSAYMLVPGQLPVAAMIPAQLSGFRSAGVTWPRLTPASAGRPDCRPAATTVRLTGRSRTWAPLFDG
jgi:hypothetical protein